VTLSALERITSSACARPFPRDSAPPPAEDPGDLYRLQCCAQDAQRELFACRTSRELDDKRAAAKAARQAANAAAGYAAKVRLSKNPEERSHSSEARELATAAGDAAGDAELLVAGLERKGSR